MKLIFITKAKENIQAAQLLFDNNLYNASANRAYYAAFHAALAALSDAGIQSERLSHEATQAHFSDQLIRRRKIYPGHLKSYLLDLQAVRDDADYKLKLISKKVAWRQVHKAKEFLERVEKEIS